MGLGAQNVKSSTPLPIRSLTGVIIPVGYARALAVLLALGALALPWLAVRQGALLYDGVPAGVAPAPVQWRPELVELPGGTFSMGSPESEKDRALDETLHSVTVKPFSIFRTEVTNRQWETVMGTRPSDCAYGCEDMHPVQEVTHYDALRYANRLTDTENALRAPGETRFTRCYDETNWSWNRACTGYRLPTEAEWEYAARGGTTTAYSFGNEVKDLCAYGNGADLATKTRHDGWTVNEACNDGYADLAPVRKFKPNAFDLYDMHGNVWEWVWDKYAAYPDKPVTSDNDNDKHPVTPSDKVINADSRVLRGGSFDDAPRWLRSANRDGSEPTLSVESVGVRCVRSLPSD